MDSAACLIVVMMASQPAASGATRPTTVQMKAYRNWRRFDYGHVYASKSFDAGKKRRVLWTWANESDRVEDDVARGWSGIQAFPRKVWLDKDGKQLLQWPVEEIETLRRGRVSLRPGTWLNTGGWEEIASVNPLGAGSTEALRGEGCLRSRQRRTIWADRYGVQRHG
ncbi:hypothetical protein EJB05_49634, partial [Eragrostis curvula]